MYLAGAGTRLKTTVAVSATRRQSLGFASQGNGRKATRRCRADKQPQLGIVGSIPDSLGDLHDVSHLDLLARKPVQGPAVAQDVVAFGLRVQGHVHIVGVAVGAAEESRHELLDVGLVKPALKHSSCAACSTRRCCPRPCTDHDWSVHRCRWRCRKQPAPRVWFCEHTIVSES